MMRRLFPVLVMVALAGVAGSCGGTQKPAARTGMTAREIIDASSPAIVRISAGRAKVGTGFILSADGLIATNLHVIGGENDIKVKLYKDPAEYPATLVVGVDASRDLALLRIRPDRALPTLRLGDSSTAAAGDKVYAIGNPLGVFDYSITDGLISQVRPLSAEVTLLQISAAISVGSSGGPLFNQYGEVIGVTTAIITEGQAINLAVPANYLRSMMNAPRPLPLDEFARTTVERGPPGPDDGAPIDRQIPDHPLTIWTGCSEPVMEGLMRSIGDAIAIGAPLYNKQTPEGFEACFRVYEGTSMKFEKDAPCQGVGEAFAAGLARARSLESYKAKAWALRDTFDGLINAFARWCQQDAACMKKFGRGTP